MQLMKPRLSVREEYIGLHARDAETAHHWNLLAREPNLHWYLRTARRQQARNAARWARLWLRRYQEIGT